MAAAGRGSWAVVTVDTSVMQLDEKD